MKENQNQSQNLTRNIKVQEFPLQTKLFNIHLTLKFTEWILIHDNYKTI